MLSMIVKIGRTHTFNPVMFVYTRSSSCECVGRLYGDNIATGLEGSINRLMYLIPRFQSYCH